MHARQWADSSKPRRRRRFERFRGLGIESCCSRVVHHVFPSRAWVIGETKLPIRQGKGVGLDPALSWGGAVQGGWPSSSLVAVFRLDLVGDWAGRPVSKTACRRSQLAIRCEHLLGELGELGELGVWLPVLPVPRSCRPSAGVGKRLWWVPSSRQCWGRVSRSYCERGDLGWIGRWREIHQQILGDLAFS